MPKTQFSYIAGMTHPPRTPTALLLTVALHAALLAALLARQQLPKPPAADRSESAITWIMAGPRMAGPRMAGPRTAVPPAPRPPAEPQRERRTPATRDHAAPQAITAPRAAAPQAANQAERQPDAAQDASAPSVAEPVIGDLSAQPATPPVSAAELLRLTLHGAGKIDQELRGGKLAPLPPPSQTMRGKIDAAFEAAHQAVRPKWYERAKVSEISSPNSRIRVYKIRTALGTYCISMADASMYGGGYSSPSYSNCP